MKTNLDEFCEALHIAPQDKLNLSARWEELTSGWREDVLPECLDIASFRRWYPLSQGPAPLEEVLSLAEKVRETASREPLLSLLAFISFRGAFESALPFYFSAMPDPIPFLGKELSGVFALMISLGACPGMIRTCAKCGVPEQYALDAMQWFGGTMYAYGTAHDHIPGRPFQFYWIRNYLDGKLFRIGRLEYLMHLCPDWVPAIYRSPSGGLAVLVREGWRFRTAEYRAGDTEPEIFTAHLREEGDSITGTLIPPDGIMDFGKTVTLRKAEWNPAVSPEDLCPSIHIPGGSRMPWEEVKASLLDARAFFEKYFHRRVPLFCCSSWILNPAWETELAGSNMANFRQQGYAFPGESWGDRAGMGFLFGRSDIPPDALPAVNSAQRAMQRCYKAKRCGAGALFFLAGDLEKLGNCYYRKLFQNFRRQPE